MFLEREPDTVPVPFLFAFQRTEGIPSPDTDSFSLSLFHEKPSGHSRLTGQTQVFDRINTSV
jgi:hypothetical protein